MKKKKVLASVATVTVFGVFTRILSFIFKIYLSRALGAEAIGLYQIAISVFYLFASLSSSGIPLVLSRKTAETEALHGKNDYSLFTTALLLGLIVSSVSLIILSIFNKYLYFLFSDQGAYPLFLVMLPALLSTTVYSVIRGWFWGKKEFTAFSATETVEEVLRILFSVLFISGLIAGISGAYAVCLAFTVSDIIIAIILFAVFLAKGGKPEKPASFKKIFLPALPVTAMRLFASLIGTLVAIILPLRLVDFGLSPSDATASFGRIAGMANPLLFAPNAIIGSLAIVLVPEMSANGAKKQFTTLNKHLNNGINFAFLVSGLFMVLYLALGEEITTLLYDDVESGKYLSFAAILMLPMSLSQLTQSALNSIGKEPLTFFNFVIGELFLVAAIVILPQFIGIYSVAVASMLALLITSVLNVYALRKYVNFSFGFLKYLALVVLFLFPSAFLSECINDLLAPHVKILALILASAGGLIMYCGLCLGTEIVDIKGFIKLRKKSA